MRGCRSSSLLLCSRNQQLVLVNRTPVFLGMVWIPGEIWCERGAVAHGLTLSLAIGLALVPCLASGTPLGSSGDREAMRGDQQHNQQDRRSTIQHPDGRESSFHVAVPSIETDAPDPASAAPEQVHIAFASSGSLEQYAVTVAWSTWPETRSQVAWGSSPRKQDNLTYGSSTCEWKPTSTNRIKCFVHTYICYHMYYNTNPYCDKCVTNRYGG